MLPPIVPHQSEWGCSESETWFDEEDPAVSGVVRALTKARDPYAHKRQEAADILAKIQAGEPVELAGFPAAARILERPQDGEMTFLRSTTRIPDWRASMNFDVLASAMEKVSAKAGRHSSNFINALNDGYRAFARIARKVHEAKVAVTEKNRLCDSYQQILLKWFREAKSAETQGFSVPPLNLSGYWDPARWESVQLSSSVSSRPGVVRDLRRFAKVERSREEATVNPAKRSSNWWPFNSNEAFPWLNSKKLPIGACRHRFLCKDGCRFGSECTSGTHDEELVKSAVQEGRATIDFMKREGY